MTSLLKLIVLTSILTSRVNCLSPWGRQNFPAPLKIEQILIGKKSSVPFVYDPVAMWSSLWVFTFYSVLLCNLK